MQSLPPMSNLPVVLRSLSLVVEERAELDIRAMRRICALSSLSLSSSYHSPRSLPPHHFFLLLLSQSRRPAHCHVH
eukprot:6930883-Pyramimonas_sp.AAC.1